MENYTRHCNNMDVHCLFLFILCLCVETVFQSNPKFTCRFLKQVKSDVFSLRCFHLTVGPLKRLYNTYYWRRRSKNSCNLLSVCLSVLNFCNFVSVGVGPSPWGSKIGATRILNGTNEVHLISSTSLPLLVSSKIINWIDFF